MMFLNIFLMFLDFPNAWKSRKNIRFLFISALEMKLQQVKLVVI
jgi:hypothetical protein